MLFDLCGALSLLQQDGWRRCERQVWIHWWWGQSIWVGLICRIPSCQMPCCNVLGNHLLHVVGLPVQGIGCACKLCTAFPHRCGRGHVLICTDCVATFHPSLGSGCEALSVRCQAVGLCHHV